MKSILRPLRLALAVLFVALPGFLVTGPTAQAASSTDRKVAAIRKEVAAINKGLKKLSTKTIPIEGISTEGAEATYFRNGADIKKAEVYGETFNSKVDLYYSGGKLIFAFETFSKNEGGIGTPIGTITEYRVYYSGGKLIRAVEGSKIMAPADAEEENVKVIEISKVLKAAIA